MSEGQKRQQELVQKIEAAFEKTRHPGDENIANIYHSVTYCEECAELTKSFRGKEWKFVTLETLVHHRDSLPLFKPEAFRYYLPAYMIATILHFEKVDVLACNTIYSLSPPRKQSWMDWFIPRVTGFTPPQQGVIREFLRWYDQRTKEEPRNKPLRKAIHFWETYK
jgi:hypothetical protein